MSTRAAVQLLLMIAATTLGGCDLGTEALSDQRVVGIIEWPHDLSGPPVLSAPDTVTAGVPFSVTITTIGLSGCWRADGAVSSRGAQLASMTPYDRVITSIDGDLAACPGALVSLPRTVQLVFGQAGAALLRVHGRSLTGEELSNAVPATVEKHIVVR